MKTATKALLASMVFLFGMTEANAQWWGKNKKVTGSGNITTETVSTGDYDGVKLVGFMDVHLEKGSEGNITVKTDDNLHEYIIIEVKDNILVARTKKGYNIRPKRGVHITVPFQDVSYLAVTGSGDLDSKDVVDSPNLDVNVTGSGDIRLDVNTGNLDAKVTGSGDILLKGKAVDTEVSVSGSGDFKGESLDSQTADVKVSGSGDIKISVSEDLKARVNGSGDVRYRGNPERRDTKVSGSGSIKSM